MAKIKKSRFGESKYKAGSSPNERVQNTRIERKVPGEIPLVLFSFKDFDVNQCPPGQTFKEWEEKGLLSDLMTKLVELSVMNRVQAGQNKCIEMYH